MGIPTPEDLNKTINEQDQGSFDTLKSSLVSYLVRYYDKGKTVVFTIAADTNTKERVVKRLCNEMREAGWRCDVNIVSDQRDGDFWEFKISAP